MILPVLAALALAQGLAGCARGEWPPLGGVERPVAAPAPAAPAAMTTPAAPAASERFAVRLREQQDRFAALDAKLVEARHGYETRLDLALAADPGSAGFAERWSDAQAALSLWNVALDDLRALNGEAAALADEAGADNAQTGEAAAAIDLALSHWRASLMTEQNRLGVLTPASIGRPGPNALEPGGRTAFAEIDFPAAADLASALGDGVRAVLARVPDAAFDVVASGEPAAAQAACMQVLRALHQAGIDHDRTAAAITPADGAVKVAIYLRKKSR